jgi:hypothetical protein
MQCKVQLVMCSNGSPFRRVGGWIRRTIEVRGVLLTSMAVVASGT